MALVKIKSQTPNEASGVCIDIQDLTKINTILKPEKLKGESALDYRIRCEELKLKESI